MKKLRCAILDDYQQAALQISDWSSLADRVDVVAFNHHFISEDELVNAINQYEIVVVMRERTLFGASLLTRLPNLKLLITSGMRNAAIDLATAESLGIIVSGTQSLSEPPTELTWALILGLARHLVRENNSLRENGRWQNSLGMDLYGKQLGLLGLGKIGGRMAEIAKAFGMRVMAWSQNLTRERTDSLGVQLAASKEELLETSDIISVHLVLSERTRGLISYADFKRMRSSALLVNTSRAQVVDQAALIEALQNNRIAGAGLDVFEIEPLPQDHVLRTLSNVLATPHLGYVTEGNYGLYFDEAIDNIKNFLVGSPVRILANPLIKNE